MGVDGISEIEKLEQELENTNDFNEQLNIINKLFAAAKLDEALISCNQLIVDIEEKKGELYLLQLATIHKIRILAFSLETDKALELSKSDIFFNNTQLTADDYFIWNQGIIYCYKFKNNYTEALAIAKSLQKNNYESLNTRNKLNHHLNLGEIYMQLAFKDLAMEELNKGIDISTKNNEYENPNLYYLLARLLYGEKKFLEAISNLNKALEIELKNEGRDTSKSIIYEMLARSYVAINENEKMLQSIQKALIHAHLHGNELHTCTTRVLNVELLNSINKFDEAIIEGEDLLKNKILIKAEKFYYSLYQMLVVSYLNTDNLNQALKYAKIYYEYIGTTGRKINNKTILENLVLIYDKKNDLPNLVKSQKELIIINEEINKEKERNAIEQFEIKYKTAQKEKEIVKLKAASTKFHLQALRSQMNPHFIFNAINSIGFNMKEGELEKSKEVLIQFASLMRSSIEFTEKNNVILKEEISFLKNYLSVEKSRLHNTFDFEIYYDENIELEFIELPSMLLQLFVENAVKHGIMPLNNKQGKIIISFEDDGENLICFIKDNGIGRKKAKEIRNASSHLGKSTTIIEERLNILSELNNNKIEVQYIDLYNEGNAMGTEVKITIPPMSFQ